MNEFGPHFQKRWFVPVTWNEKISLLSEEGKLKYSFNRMWQSSIPTEVSEMINKMSVTMNVYFIFILDTISKMNELVIYDQSNQRPNFFFRNCQDTIIFKSRSRRCGVEFRKRLCSIICGSYCDLRSRYVSLTKRWL